MNLNECIAEDAAFPSFGELGKSVRRGPNIAPGELADSRAREIA